MAISYILRQIPCFSANELKEELKGLFLGWNTLFTLENVLLTIRVVFQHVLQAIYLLFVGITTWKLRLF